MIVLMDALKLVSTIGNNSTFVTSGPEIHIEDERVSVNFMSVSTFFLIFSRAFVCKNEIVISGFLKLITIFVKKKKKKKKKICDYKLRYFI